MSTIAAGQPQRFGYVTVFRQMCHNRKLWIWSASGEFGFAEIGELSPHAAIH
jgi:hypothetical protein